MLYWNRLGLMFVISMSGVAFASSSNTLSSEPVKVNFGDWGKSLSDDFYKFLSNSILVFGGSSPEATKLDELKNRTSNLKKELEVFNQAVQGAVPVVQDSSASSVGSSLGSSTSLPLPGATTSLPDSTMTTPARLQASSAGLNVGSSTSMPLPGATTSLPDSTMTTPASLQTSSAGLNVGSSTSMPLPGATTSLPDSTMTAPSSSSTSPAGLNVGSSTSMPLPGATTSLPDSTMTAPSSSSTPPAGLNMGSASLDQKPPLSI